MTDVVIIGAGPAGLTAAYELSKLNIGSTILESARQVGGISRTETYNGFRFDIGGHRFFSKVPYINKIWHELLGPDFIERPRLSRIHYRGHFYDYPLRPLNALSGLGVVESFKIGLDYTKTKVFPHHEEENFEQWVTNRFGARLYNIFFKTYTEKVWGLPCKEISAEWAAQRIKNLSLRQAVYNAIADNLNGTSKEVITSLIDRFHYPRLGPGMMWEHCCELLETQGHQIHLAESVVQIHHSNGVIRAVQTQNACGESREIQGDQFISSMPLKDLVHALNPLPPREILDAADSLRYRDYLTVVLIIDQETIFPDNWIYIHTPEVKMGRIQNYKNWSADMVPDPSKTTLGLEYFLWETDDEWHWSDERLIDLGIKEAGQIGFLQGNEIIDGTVVRVKKAYPVYDQQYQANVHTLRRYMDTFSNLQTIGRNGLHRYNNQDHSMLTGIYAARNIAGASYDVWAVNTEEAFHEDGLATQTPVVSQEVSRQIDVEKDIVIVDEIEFLFSNLDALALGTAMGLASAALLFLATAILILGVGAKLRDS